MSGRIAGITLVVSVISSVLFVLVMQYAWDLRAVNREQAEYIRVLQDRYSMLQTNVKEVTKNAESAKSSLRLGKQESSEEDRDQLATAIPDAVRDRLCQHLSCTGSD